MVAPEILGNRTNRAMDIKRRIHEAERTTVPFKLIHTSGYGPTIEVEVQRPSLPFLMSAGMIPDVFRSIVDSHIKKFGQSKVAKGDFDLDQQATEELMRIHGANILTFQQDLWDATVIAGFVIPPVTKDKELAYKEDSPFLWIGDIAVEDREAYYEWCNAEGAAEADAVKSDSGSVSPDDVVGVVPVGEGIRDFAERSDSRSTMGPRRDEI